MRFIQAIILLALLVAIGIFAVQNTHVIMVRFLDVTVSAPVALVAIAAYLLGMLTGWTVVAFLTRSIRQVTEHRKD